jgi:hypothetical protein
MVPAICDTCGTVFPSGFVIGQGARNITMVGNKSGPCPTCGGMGSIPDGLYDFVGETLSIASTWSPERIQRLIAALQGARNAANPREATEAALAEDDELLDVVRRLVIPRNPAEFWAFIAALLALLMLLNASLSDPGITVNEQTVIQQIVNQPTVPAEQKPKLKLERRDVPKPLKKHNRRSKKRRK